MDKKLIINKIVSIMGFGSDAEFARYLGISPQNLAKWKSRGTYDAELIYTKCPQLNPEWLLTGKGKELKADVGGGIDGNEKDLGSELNVSELIELHKGTQIINSELNQRLKTSQNQIDTLLEILKNK